MTSSVAPEPVLREMTSLDIPDLVDLDEQLFGGDAWSEATWWAELAERPRREYVVLGDVTTLGTAVASGGRPLAYGGVDVSGDTADIMTVGVAPEAQGRGLGARVLAALETRATARGAGGALLEVRADNAAALALYARAGWRQVHVRRRYYQPGGVDAIILAKQLGTDGKAPADAQ